MTFPMVISRSLLLFLLALSSMPIMTMNKADDGDQFLPLEKAPKSADLANFLRTFNLHDEMNRNVKETTENKVAKKKKIATLIVLAFNAIPNEVFKTLSSNKLDRMIEKQKKKRIHFLKKWHDKE